MRPAADDRERAKRVKDMAAAIKQGNRMPASERLKTRQRERGQGNGKRDK